MAMWKEATNPRQSPTPVPEPMEPSKFDVPSRPALAPSPAPSPFAAAPVASAETGLPRKESLIAADITIEGKVEGGGSVRIAGKFKGDVNVQGDLTIEAGAKLTGGVRADKVTIAGELEGNVEQASRVDLLQTGVVIGDLKAGSLTVATGARMRGQAEFGWDDGKGPKTGKQSNGQGSESGTGS
jgi:cytoskeletal protein CcmA (bactofilin family)